MSFVELRFLDRWSALLSCCQIACDAVQTGWSPILLAKLPHRFGATGWRTRCKNWLGKQAQVHVPERDHERFDLHQLCTLMHKLATFLAFCWHHPSARPTQSTFIYDCCSLCRELTERMRYLLNTIDRFRQLLAHDLESLSVTEALEALLAMEEIGRVLQADLSTENFSSGRFTRPQTQMSVQAYQSTLAQEKLQQCIECAKRLLFPGHSACGGLVARPLIKKAGALKILGLLLLAHMTRCLRDVPNHVQRNGHPTGVDREPSETVQTGNAAEPSGDLLTIYFQLKGTLKVVTNMNSRNGVFEDQRVLHQLLHYVHVHGSPEAYRRFNLEPSQTAKNLVSAFEYLVGKHGLRKRIYHEGSHELTAGYMQQCIKKGVEILDFFSWQASSHCSLLLSYCLAMKPKTVSDILVNMEVDRRYNQPSLPTHHHILQPRPNLFGRSSELENVIQQLKALGTVALVGESGIGKSALAVQVAYKLRPLFPQQYWLTASTPMQLQQSLATVAQLACPLARGGLAPSSQSPTVELAKEGAKFLAASRRLLLVIDDVCDLDMLLKSLPHVCFYRHTILLTTTIADVPLRIDNQVKPIATQRLEPLSTEAVLEYIASMCPSLCNNGTLSSISIQPAIWVFIEQQAKQNPLAAQLLANFLKQHDVSLQAVDSLILSFSSQDLSLMDMAEHGGNSRFHRCLLNAVQSILESCSASAKMMLLTLSFLGTCGAAVPLKLLSAALNHLGSQDDSSGQQVVTLMSTPHQAMTRLSTQNALKELCAVSLVSVCHDSESVSVPLLIQKAVFELECANRRKPASFFDTIVTCVCSVVTQELDRVLKCACATAPESRNAAVEELTCLVPIGQSLLSSVGKYACEEVNLHLAIRLGRLIFSLHSDYHTSKFYYDIALAILHKQQQCKPEVCAVVLAEYAGIQLAIGNFSQGKQLLQGVFQVLMHATGPLVQDPFGGGLVIVSNLLLMVQQRMCSLPRCVTEDSGLIGSDSMDPRSAWSCLMPSKINIPLPALKLDCQMRHLSTIQAVCSSDDDVEHFLQALATWYSGDMEEGIQDMVFVALNSLKKRTNGTPVPLLTVKMTLVILELLTSVYDDEFVTFYFTLITDVALIQLESWILELPPGPCLPKVRIVSSLARVKPDV